MGTWMSSKCQAKGGWMDSEPQATPFGLPRTDFLTYVHHDPFALSEISSLSPDCLDPISYSQNTYYIPCTKRKKAKMGSWTTLNGIVRVLVRHWKARLGNNALLSPFGLLQFFLRSEAFSVAAFVDKIDITNNQKCYNVFSHLWWDNGFFQTRLSQRK